jgi:hypothetical protein
MTMTHNEISQRIAAVNAERDMALIRIGEMSGALTILREWQATLPEDAPQEAAEPSLVETPVYPDGTPNDSAAADS